VSFQTVDKVEFVYFPCNDPRERIYRFSERLTDDRDLYVTYNRHSNVDRMPQYVLRLLSLATRVALMNDSMQIRKRRHAQWPRLQNILATEIMPAAFSDPADPTTRVEVVPAIPHQISWRYLSISRFAASIGFSEPVTLRPAKFLRALLKNKLMDHAEFHARNVLRVEKVNVWTAWSPLIDHVLQVARVHYMQRYLAVELVEDNPPTSEPLL
jgi:hypothetical protein